MKKDNITPDERMNLEDAIMDAHMAADKLLSLKKDDQKADLKIKLLELTVSDALEYIQNLSSKLRDDPKTENYKLHMLVPLQLTLMLKEGKEDAKKT